MINVLKNIKTEQIIKVKVLIDLIRNKFGFESTLTLGECWIKVICGMWEIGRKTIFADWIINRLAVGFDKNETDPHLEVHQLQFEMGLEVSGYERF